ncbi:cytoplasmic dynein intermediate chain [Cardiosporidium cionae]|uniref:Cytoplasmic dynein intermediate chain n=1 Tax=Cardiosporidium cionae TaxID=476202 RepID=A0ABQ7JEW7_9APIC|nr:cytoplasmic dynein intermediate chain [Cardiosporidium cionae]|eukprot:KAF8822435.1 cytoplasmic dynein intermediate chain [Cardiosporidium cionae]
MDGSNPSSPSAGGILTPEERSALQLRLKERQKELEEKRKHLQTFNFETRGTVSTTDQAVHPQESAKAQDLLNEIRQKLDEVIVTPPENFPAEKRAAERHPAPVEPDLKLAFKIQKKGISEAVAVTCFDKSVQADAFISEETPTGVDESTFFSTEAISPPLRLRSSIVTISVEEVKEEDALHPLVISKPGMEGEVSTVKKKSQKGVPPIPTVELTDEEKEKILSSVKFGEFFERSTKLIERALGESDMFDLMADFSGTLGSETDQSDIQKLKSVQVYCDSKWSTGRPITDLRASTTFHDLFLTAYGQPETTSLIDPDGCVLVWNMAMPQRPEYIFTYQSAVCSALFNKFQPNIIIGGTFSGSIVIWDSRAKSKPVQRTALTPRGHMHPVIFSSLDVYSTEIVGTQNAHNLVSVDTDGRLCQWSLNMLVNPSETVSLKKRNKEVSCGCISFPDGETNTLMGGLEDGSLFEAHIHGSKVGIMELYESHHSLITGLHFHPHGEGNVDFTGSHAKPLYSFENLEDYIYDVKWHPIHPAVFVCASGEGQINVWNLLQDWEADSFATHAGSAVNKVAWSADGRRLLSGERSGKVTLWNAAAEIIQPRFEDWERFETKISNAKHGPVGPYSIPQEGMKALG